VDYPELGYIIKTNNRSNMYFPWVEVNAELNVLGGVMKGKEFNANIPTLYKIVHPYVTKMVKINLDGTYDASKLEAFLAKRIGESFKIWYQGVIQKEKEKWI
jgi:hypothetical protein